MALDERYIVGIKLEEFFVDKATGEPLSNGYIEFWKDNQRASPKLVYELTGSPPNYTYSALPNQLDLSSVGTVVNADGDNVAIYYYPYDADGEIELYYIKVYNEDDELQFVREAWPNLTAADDPTKVENSISNEISNSQFVDVTFNPDYGMTISFATSLSNKSYPIAPDWDIVISSNGAGTVTINRTAIAGSANLPTNPPYTLDILAGGGNLTSLRLRQRLSNNPGIWADGYLAGHMVVSSLDGASHQMTMIYSPSVAAAATVIVSGVTGLSGYKELSDTISLPASANTDDADSGYVDIDIILPVAGEYNITSVQVVGLNNDEQHVTYDQQTVNRQKDYLFNYYNPLLQYKPISSYLIGWDFPSNPAQFLGPTISLGAIGANKSAYLWDQLIGFQSTDNSMSVTKTNGDLRIAATLTTQMAIIQYLPSTEAVEILTQRLSAHLKCYTNVIGGLIGTVSLWYTADATLPDLNSPNYNSIVSSLDAEGLPSNEHGNWTQVTRDSYGNAKFVVSSLSQSTSDEFMFTGWEIGTFSEALTATFFAIVVGFESMDVGEFVSFQSISLCPGDIATIPAPLGMQGTIPLCERFYEKSYNINVYRGTVTDVGKLTYLQTEDGSAVRLRSFCFAYRVNKRSVPTIFMFSPITGTVGNVSISALRSGAYTSGSPSNPLDVVLTTNYTEVVGTTGAFYTPKNNNSIISSVSPSGNGTESLVSYHYVADSRLGLIA